LSIYSYNTVAKSIQDIKDELKNRDIGVKATALQKLTYLQQLGHDMNWASFQIIEVMSQERFGLKRIGFLAAAQSFHEKTDVIVLTTALLKKEFSAKSAYEIGLAVSTLASIATEDLSRDLLSDVVSMLTSSRPYIRKKATLVLFKLYTKYPQGLRLTFDHLKRRLSDDVASVISCAINVICELARKKPSNYLSLAPELFTLMTSSTNNWMLIKIAKLMSALVQEEPRLARKLLEPLANIVQTTPAKSLMYECISTLTYALQHTKKADGTDAKNVPAVVRLCTDRLREFVRDPDQNLKYLGLSGLVQLMKSHPRVVAEHRELVLQCLTDEDVTIRLRALELIAGMVTRRNLEDIVKSLMTHLEEADGHYQDELINKIIFICSRDKYAYLADFSWYVGVLAKLAYIGGAKNSATIAGQLLDVAVRVEDVRPFAVQTLLPFLGDPVLFQNARVSYKTSQESSTNNGDPATATATAPTDGSSVAAFSSARAGEGQVLYAAAWTVGEYCSIIPAKLHGAVLDALLQPTVAKLPPAVQAVYVQCALKVVSAAAQSASASGSQDTSDKFLELATSVVARLTPFSQSTDVEVQERACLVQQLLATLGVPYTPPPPSEAALAAAATAAAAKAESDLLSLMSGGDAAGAASAAVAAPVTAASVANSLPPLDFKLDRVTAVLSNLFSEALKPVNPTAQSRVPVPEGLNLESWINPAENVPEVADKGFSYNYISFEDSFGMSTAEEDDEEAAGTSKKGRSRRQEGGVGNGADEEDDEWFSSMQKKNKARDRELWGGDDDEDDSKKKGKKGKKGKGDDDERPKKGSGVRDPFMLAKDDKKGRSGTQSSDIDVDSIPIKTLSVDSLKPNALDVSIFGDFGGKKKTGSAVDGKKKKKKAADDDDDAPAGGRSFKIVDDDDMPEGAVAQTKVSSVNKSFDALANVDLTTPLGEDEVLQTRTHRGVRDPAALQSVGTKKGKGRARVLGAGEDEPATAAPIPEEKKKKSKKSDEKGDEKEGKKSKKSDEKGDEKEGKKTKKAEKVAATPGVGDESAAEPPCMLPLCLDKIIRLSYAVSGASNGGCTLFFRIEPKSAKKTVDYIDVTFADPSLVKDGGSSGADSGSYRLCKDLKVKEKDKKVAKKGTVTLNVTDPLVSFTVALKISYLVTGTKVPASIDGTAIIRASSLLVPHAIEKGAFQNIMVNEGKAFITKQGLVPLITAGAPADGGVEATFAAIVGIFRAFAVSRAAGSKQALLYSKTLGTASSPSTHIAGLLNVDGGNFQVTIKSVIEGHAERILSEITEAVAIASKQAEKDAKKADKDDE
jgi:AP-3 complex subunit delta